MTPADVQVTFCATLVDQWLALGLQHAVVAPGSRSTPMAMKLAAVPEPHRPSNAPATAFAVPQLERPGVLE